MSESLTLIKFSTGHKSQVGTGMAAQWHFICLSEKMNHSEVLHKNSLVAIVCA